MNQGPLTTILYSIGDNRMAILYKTYSISKPTSRIGSKHNTSQNPGTETSNIVICKGHDVSYNRIADNTESAMHVAGRSNHDPLLDLERKCNPYSFVTNL